MKILVINDDHQLCAKAAAETLSGHEVTTVYRYDHALRHLDRVIDPEHMLAVMTELLGDDPRNDRWKGENLNMFDRRKKYKAAEDQANQTCRPPLYDAVLCGLMMPPGKDQQEAPPSEFMGGRDDIPVGFSLALLAALRGVKYIAVVGENKLTNRSPGNAMLSRLSGNGSEWDDEKSCARFAINGATVGFFPHLYHLESGGTDWGKILATLMRGVQMTRIDDPFAPKP